MFLPNSKFILELSMILQPLMQTYKLISLIKYVYIIYIFIYYIYYYVKIFTVSRQINSVKLFFVTETWLNFLHFRTVYTDGPSLALYTYLRLTMICKADKIIAAFIKHIWYEYYYKLWRTI